MSLYAVVLCVAYFLALLPSGTALALGRGLGSLVYRSRLLRRGVVVANMRHVFGETKTEPEIQALARGAYRQFGMTLVEMLRCGVTDLRGRPSPFDIERGPELHALKAAGAAIICTPHQGNFDLGSYVFGIEGLAIHIVMKPLESARFGRWLIATRESYGHTMHMKQGDVMDRLRTLLAAGEWVGLLPDQNAKKRGVTVDFLGKPASLYKGTAILHLETGAPIVICVGVRSDADPGRHLVRTFVLPPFAATGDPESDVKALMQRIADTMTGVILEHPEQYFWFHRLWGKDVALRA